MDFTKGLVIVLSGFSGAGKGTIMKHLLKHHKDEYFLSISATSRQMRTGEKEGRDYFFKTREEFEEMIQKGELLEYTEFNGNYYGTPKEYVESLVNDGKDVVLEIEIDGALQVKKIYPEALLLFVTPPDATSLKDRLVGRATETKEVIDQRLSIAYDQSFLMDKYDYLVVNDDLSSCVKRVHNTIQSERYRASRNLKNIDIIQKELKMFSKGEN
ncbi:MAG: guanylate kinase [Lachnospiraceae bacterium]|nr:guanylate kinase [Lachnospiraceae bacterium]